MNRDEILKINKHYWDTNADLWFGATALPQYGVHFVTENELHLFGDVAGKKLLEICCGSGHSLKYHGDRNAGELWGLDISHRQLENAQRYLAENGYTAKLICAPMESDPDIPKGYFDYVYSIYGIGWTTDLDGTFQKIASYLKKDGVFIFSWHHTLNYCIGWDGGEAAAEKTLVMHKSYFDETLFSMPVDGSEILLRNRKISTYINALVKAGFMIEQMVEQTDEETMQAQGDIGDKAKRAQMIPLSVLFKARKV